MSLPRGSPGWRSISLTSYTFPTQSSMLHNITPYITSSFVNLVIVLLIRPSISSIYITVSRKPLMIISDFQESNPPPSPALQRGGEGGGGESSGGAGLVLPSVWCTAVCRLVAREVTLPTPVIRPYKDPVTQELHLIFRYTGRVALQTSHVILHSLRLCLCTFSFVLRVKCVAVSPQYLRLTCRIF